MLGTNESGFQRPPPSSLPSSIPVSTASLSLAPGHGGLHGLINCATRALNTVRK
ncbi:predicted protein [Histoplasma mississippiense (nom. inval.)]|uniref:predicted protein n=1 Tax=Ajellomyces capsulatus (strain NAm1 / WU24) TaxID=2059318 RepID=UPI000157CB7C|nr:predicted protein [Histoplasma mississippiense (nom. inval.)]EDN10037.1 predicted protein [Histoplasma mississippiense (nom. inval.)]